MEDVHMDVFYMSTQSKLKDSSPIFSYVKKWVFNKKIHQKWSFGFWKAKFGVLDKDYVNIDWKLFEVKYSNCILY
jgi:hypothetical protein